MKRLLNCGVTYNLAAPPFCRATDGSSDLLRSPAGVNRNETLPVLVARPDVRKGVVQERVIDGFASVRHKVECPEWH